MAELPAVERLGGGQVLIRGRVLVDLWRLAAAGARQAERQDGIALSAATAGLLEALRREAEQVPSAAADVRAEVRPDVSELTAVPTSEALGAEEVAQMMNVSARHVRRIAPTLGGYRVDGHWRFDPVELALILAARNERTAA